MTLRVQFSDRDRGARALLGRLRRASRFNRELRVGILGRQAAEPKRGSEGVTLIAVATFHEFGEGNNPERSFIRATFDERIRQLEELERRVGRGILKGRFTEETGLGIMGEWLVAQIRDHIRRGISPELKPATKRRKGPNKETPLIDTGQLVQSITHEVG